jgi:hypothetical protein
MYYTAQLDISGIVTAVTETQEPLTADNCISLPNFDTTVLGKRYENGIFVDVPEPPIRILSRYAFRSRFTTDEKQAIYAAAESNVLIKIWLDDLASAENIDLDLPETTSNLNALETAGLIGPGRATEILS